MACLLLQTLTRGNNWSLLSRSIVPLTRRLPFRPFDHAMPMQKEVIHLTLGTLPHHTTTHFFNQQTSHFDYSQERKKGNGDDDEEPEASSSRVTLDPVVDFQEGIGALDGQPSFFPRQFVVDFRESIGTSWNAYNAIYKAPGDDEDDAEGEEGNEGTVVLARDAANEGLRAWHSPAEVHIDHGRVHKSRRHSLYDSDNDEDEHSDEDESEKESGGAGVPLTDSDSGRQEGASESGTHMKNVAPRRHSHIDPPMYAHNSHHPRSVRALPRYFAAGSLVSMNSPQEEGQVPLSSFEMGVNLSRSMERNSSILDDHIRWFAEDSDLLQSFNLCASISDGFAGMAHETLELLADDYPKTPVVSWGLATSSTGIEKDPQQERLRKTNEILSLWSLSSASLYVPVRLPAPLANRERIEATSPFKRNIDWSSMYYSGALFASFIDTALLPTRLHDESKRCPTAALTSTLNWRRDTPIASLGGCLPTPLLAPLKEAARPLDPIEALLASRGYDTRKSERQGFHAPESADDRAKKAAANFTQHWLDLSNGMAKKMDEKVFARSAVARDPDAMAQVPTKEALEAWTGLDEPSGRVEVLPIPFNVRSASFPQIFRGLTTNGRPQPAGHASHLKISTLPAMASLSTTPATMPMLDDARRFLDERLVRGHEPLHVYGLGGTRGRSGAGQAASDDTEGPLGGRDGLIEVCERLEELLSAYDDGSSGFGASGDRVGTDEEVEAEADSDWDLE